MLHITAPATQPPKPRQGGLSTKNEGVCVCVCTVSTLDTLRCSRVDEHCSLVHTQYGRLKLVYARAYRSGHPFDCEQRDRHSTTLITSQRERAREREYSPGSGGYITPRSKPVPTRWMCTVPQL